MPCGLTQDSVSCLFLAALNWPILSTSPLKLCQKQLSTNSRRPQARSQLDADEFTAKRHIRVHDELILPRELQGRGTAGLADVRSEHVASQPPDGTHTCERLFGHDGGLVQDLLAEKEVLDQWCLCKTTNYTTAKMQIHAGGFGSPIISAWRLASKYISDLRAATISIANYLCSVLVWSVAYSTAR